MTPNASRGSLVLPKAFPEGGQELFQVASQGLYSTENGLVLLDFSYFCFSVFQK